VGCTPTPGVGEGETAAPSGSAVASEGSAARPTPLVVPASATPVSALAEIDVPGASSILVADDALWVAAVTGLTVSFVRIDPRSRETTRTIASEVLGASGIGHGSLWITDFERDELSRYDLDTGERIATIATGSGPDGVLIAEGSVWVPDHAGGSVTRVDPATNEVTATVVVGTPGRGGPAGLAPAAGRIWVTEPIPGQLTGIDPATNEPDVEFSLDLIPCPVSAVEDRLWVGACLDTAPLFQVVDPTGGPGAPISTRETVDFPTVIGGRLWLAAGERLIALDPASLEVVDVLAFGQPLRSNPVEAFGSVWAVLADQVLELDPRLFAAGD
jgi:hypothetical protein